MTVQERRGPSLGQQLQPLIKREVTAIAAIDTAIAHETAPDYVVMFQDAKNGKQANIEQLATLLRMRDGAPDEGASLRKALTTSKAAVASRISTTAVLRSMRHAEIDPFHRGALDETLDRLPLTDAHTSLIGVSAFHSIHWLTRILYDAIAGAAISPESE